jgi:hypothetical protein
MLLEYRLLSSSNRCWANRKREGEERRRRSDIYQNNNVSLILFFRAGRTTVTDGPNRTEISNYMSTAIGPFFLFFFFSIHPSQRIVRSRESKRGQSNNLTMVSISIISASKKRQKKMTNRQYYCLVALSRWVFLCFERRGTRVLGTNCFHLIE